MNPSVTLLSPTTEAIGLVAGAGVVAGARPAPPNPSAAWPNVVATRP